MTAPRQAGRRIDVSERDHEIGSRAQPSFASNARFHQRTARPTVAVYGAQAGPLASEGILCNPLAHARGAAISSRERSERLAKVGGEGGIRIYSRI